MERAEKGKRIVLFVSSHMATRSGRSFARNSSGYFASLGALRRAHHRLFEASPRAYVNRVVIGNSDRGLIQCTLRLRASETGSVDPRPSVAATILALTEQFEDQHLYEVSITVNALRCRTYRDGRSTYSVFYGQSFGNSGEFGSADHHNILGDIYEVRDAGDVDLFPSSLTFDMARPYLDSNMGDSAVRIIGLINYVIIFTRPIEGDEKTDTPAEANFALFEQNRLRRERHALANRRFKRPGEEEGLPVGKRRVYGFPLPL